MNETVNEALPKAGFQVKKAKKKRIVGKHERCPTCHYPFGTGTCDTCRDPKCDECGIRLLTCERERGSKCAKHSPDAAKSVRKAVANAAATTKLVADKPDEKFNVRWVAVALTD
jgi:hypothetical protein